MQEESECFYCGAELPEFNDSGFSEYCGEDCFAKQNSKDRKEGNL